MDNLQLNISIGPQSADKNNTQRLMLKVLIALLPTTIWGIYTFKTEALITLALCMGCSVLFEYLFCIIVKKKNTISDLSALVTGLLLGLNLTSTIPWYICVIGSFVAIVMAKQLYGGIGYNFINPALAARCFLLISFTARMTSFKLDGITSATPLAIIKSKGYEKYHISELLIGHKAGVIGEVSIIALLIGAVFLIITKVIRLRIPFFYILSFAIVTFLFGQYQYDMKYTLVQILSGGLIIGAFFMATDYTTSPVTPRGEIIFGIIIGILTALFRIPNSEGVSYAIIIGNLLVPLIDRVTIPRHFGKEVVKREG